ncbi:hypothetical protein GOP47_0019561 [Adiantum capillus-veneris]|uniref:G3BP-like protein n=1 Tax=Adiantum capillus-veneris TaxID=13818 RepID=A0A9D4UBA9_ADICA|nr:hypothetical protein GOP47_0019561 [Adiantum capillus-veneris]
MASTVPVTAQLVGHAFVSQYYNVLHQLPHMVYRFYTDASRLTRAEAGPDGAVLCARSQVEIHNTVMSMGYEECKAEIVTVDSSESIGGSVLVLVTGVMHMHRSNGRRNFVQTFLLAPQERGYYVLNDIFRYLDDEAQPVVQVHKMANGSLDMFDRLQISSAEADSKARGFTPHVIAKEAVPQEAPLQEYVELPHTNVLKADQAGVDDRVSRQPLEVLQSERGLPNEQLSVPEDTRPFEDGSADKKSYASILRFPRDSSAVSAQPATSTVLHQQPSEQNNYSYQHSSAGLLANPPPSAFATDDSTNESAEVKSVYIKNLPSNVTELQLEEDLIKAGCSRPISVILKSYKDGGVYAFVDFDDSASAINAIEASPISVGGRRAHIEERKSMYAGGPTRGRGGRGRGTLSSSGARGRGPSSNASSSMRGASGYGEGDASSRGRGARSSRAGYGGSSAR